MPTRAAPRLKLLPLCCLACIICPVQLSIIKDKYHPKSPWLVVLPARISTTGKRQFRRFHTRTEAAEFIATVRKNVRANGEKALAMLPAAIAADAAAAHSLLEGTGLSLSDAVRQLLAHLQHEAVACAQYIPLRGTGSLEAPCTPCSPLREDLTLLATLQLVETQKSHHSAATMRSRRSAINALLRAVPRLEKTPIELITTEEWQHILQTTWPTSAQSYNGARRYLHALYAYIIKRRLIRIENPITPIDLQHVREAEITALPPEELQALFAAARPATAADLALANSCTLRHLRANLTYLRPYIALCAFAGIRPTECTRLRWQDVNFEERIISVRHGSSKTGGQRHIHMNATLYAWLATYKPANATPTDLITPPESLPSRLYALRLRAGFNSEKKWQNDCLRHSYATYYLKAQHGSITDLQLNMGHRSTMLLYTRYTNMAGVTSATAQAWWNITPSLCPL